MDYKIKPYNLGTIISDIIDILFSIKLHTETKLTHQQNQYMGNLTKHEKKGQTKQYTKNINFIEVYQISLMYKMHLFSFSLPDSNLRRDSRFTISKHDVQSMSLFRKLEENVSNLKSNSNQNEKP
jgi:hypothetical protein